MTEPRPTGRPSLYSQKLADHICQELMTGRSLRQICQDEGMPDRVTVIRWMGKDDAFATKCARARDEQADLMDDRILDVADQVERGELDPHAAKVVISALQWRASKLKPKKYGEKVSAELSGPNGGPIEYKDMTETEISSRLAALLSAGSLTGSSGGGSDDSPADTDKLAG